jgi:hypothetical protein
VIAVLKSTNWPSLNYSNITVSFKYAALPNNISDLPSAIVLSGKITERNSSQAADLFTDTVQ